MSKERELLKKILATRWLDHELSCEVEAILAQPEQTEHVPTVKPNDFNFCNHMFESAYVRSMREELARSINEANKRER